MSISSEISRLTQAKADIKTAIENKGVTVPSSATLDDYPELIDDIEQGSTPNLQSKSVSITENGTTTVEPDPGYDGLSEVGVSVNVQGGGGGASEEDDVRFIDYDGTLLHSYSASDFLSLTEMPENPTHEGLTSQGWNWTLADAKEQVTEMGTCDIGQAYVTDDGKTRIYIELQDMALSPYLHLNKRSTSVGNAILEIDWGDGTQVETFSDSVYSFSVQHTYASPGTYVITLDITGGEITLSGNKNGTYILRSNTTDNQFSAYSYASCINHIEIGNDTYLDTYTFFNCYNLETITLPKNVKFSTNDYAFQNCNSLKAMTFNEGCTIIGNSSFRDCYALKYCSMPKTVTQLTAYAFQNCRSIKSPSLPTSISIIQNNAFSYCSLLKRIKLPRISSIFTGTFADCVNLEYIEIPDTVEKIETSAFNSCSGLKSIYLPQSITNSGTYVFNNCRSLKKINIPKNLSVIQNGFMNNCHTIKSITLPEGTTSIGTSSFGNCYSLAEIHILATTPPTLVNTNAIPTNNSMLKIFVPSDSLASYQSATNWSNSSIKSKLVGE